MSRQKPQGVFTEPLGLLTWMRDKLYDVVYSEGDFALQFMADLMRGPDYGRETKHLNRQAKYQNSKASLSQSSPSEKPMTKDDQRAFVELLRRKPSEPQMVYWKRKKAILNSPNKHDLLAQYKQLQANMAERKTQTPETEFIQQYREKATMKRSQKARKR